MRPILMRHVETSLESFRSWKNGSPYLHNPWHYHPECEMTYIHKGEGTLFIGNEVLEYHDNEIILIGPNLPHEWRSDIVSKPDLYSESYSIHFRQDLFSDEFYQLPELNRVSQLLKQSVNGIRVYNNSIKSFLIEQLTSLPETKGIYRITKLLQILDELALSKDYQIMTGYNLDHSTDYIYDQRMNSVSEYVLKNYKKPIKISEVADKINMTKTSFCRFFKERANKSFIAYLNQVRIDFACKLLLEGNYTISQISYESGFGNVSNFNKQFKKIKKVTPSEFLNKFLNSTI